MNFGKPSPWTPPIVELFHALLAERPVLHYRKIAERLSAVNGYAFTKNACIGFARRNGVPRRKPPRLSSKGRKPRKPRIRPHTPKLRIAPRIVVPRRPNKLRIWQLKPDECLWPIDDVSPFFFCAQPKTDGSSYCWKHTVMSCPSLARTR